MKLRRGATFDGADLIGLVWRLVRDHDFDPAEFVLAGSARLWQEGFLPQLSDLDLVAIGSTWDTAWDMAVDGQAEFGEGTLNHAKTVRMFESRIEIYNAWIPPHSDPHRLVDEADQIRGLLYLPLWTVVDYKTRLDRPKDRDDLALLRSSSGTARFTGSCIADRSGAGQETASSTAIVPTSAITIPDPMTETRSHQNFQCAMRLTSATSAANDSR
ncbi:hypothetical protein LO763_20480 [Glycomyces sp. A-F 0318]|uniref:hypothetical protein n=1 Tax=Glycomyces amatae TaxID=2881355 RepID=UPI001E639C9F|nr:hypothetical protein [Glycomyces amatae]MCD0445992.1 hypothetical protein [Glycomyces amatae]